MMMKRINLELTNEEYYDFMDLLEHSTFSEAPFINHVIAEKILRKIEDD